MRLLLIMFLLCMITGCSVEKQAQYVPAETISAEPEYLEPDTLEGTGKSEHGVLTAEDGYPLTGDQEEIIFAYMERYYESL